MNLNELREPVEVYQAASGDPEPLAKRIESGAEMFDWERETLAAYLRGELVPPKRKRGQSTLSYLARRTEEEVKRRRIIDAAVWVEFIMRELRKTGQNYRKRTEVIDHVSKEKCLSGNEILRLNTMLKSGAWKESDSQKYLPVGISQNFHFWLLKEGRLQDFPQLVAYSISPEIIIKALLDEGLVTQDEIEDGRSDIWLSKYKAEASIFKSDSSSQTRARGKGK